MTTIFQLAIAMHTLLFALEAGISRCRLVLPLGGSPIAQFGIVMAFAAAAFELAACVR
ncbi:MAG: hypothetical protein QOE79_1226 [Sphingomonadales bacterium]|jgi:hypothetical protein|nr:hypothetical protein [Sphingomonadales bacterium]MEA3051076.1 hypothetical protein [Sphingomonadales bacterium]